MSQRHPYSIAAFTLVELPAASRREHAAFTLVELMISIAIVLILMLGINFIFSSTSRTVGTGMALMSINRDLRATRKVMENDFANALAADEMPALIIQSEQVFAFRDKQDQLGDFNGIASTYDVDGDSSNGDEIVMPADPTAPPYAGVYNFRRHRVDRLSFFIRSMRGEYARQTGNDTAYVGAQSSSDAWVHYGFLCIGNDAWTQFQWPAGTGVNVLPLAADWFLGRNIFLMGDPAHIPANAGSVNALWFGTPSTLNRSPGYPGAGTTPWNIDESRVDLARITLEDFYTYLDQYVKGVDTGAEPRWWDPGAAGAAGAPSSMNYLFAAKPLTNRSNTGVASLSTEMALATPVFLRGCTQFIVEFAGDFYDQSAAGPAEPVGTVDWDDLPAAQGGGKRIHWYGAPRDVDGDGIIDVGPVSSTVTPPTGVTIANARWLNPTAPQTPPVFEHIIGAAAPFTYVWAWGPIGTRQQPTNAIPASPSHPVPTLAKQGHPYAVRPSLIRITVEGVDQNGRLADGQRLEMIFSIPDAARR